jgi:quercetin dioxygenase-like cupin family protein
MESSIAPVKITEGPRKLAANAANVYVRIFQFKNAGDTNEGHKHTYDHITYLSRGRIKVFCDGKEYEFEAPFLFITPKDKVHRFEALEDNTEMACIHALRLKGDDEVATEEMVTTTDIGGLISGLTKHEGQPA